MALQNTYPDIAVQPPNFGVGETYSWIGVANDAGRPMYAQASYITNLADLQVSLSAGNVDIGSVHIQDFSNGLYVSVADIGLTGPDAGKGAIRVLTQDIDSKLDSITIGDVKGNTALINVPTSAVNVFVVNPVSAVSLTNQLTGITVLNPVTAVTVSNPVTSVAVISNVTNWDVLSAAINNSTYTTLPSNPASEITILNNTGGIIYIKNAAKTIGLPIDNNTSVDLKLVGDTSEVAIKASSNNKTVFATFISYN
jgi:hypothetical protein